MSNQSEASETLEALPDGVLGRPDNSEVIDATDEIAARRILDATPSDAPQTQQGRMKSDVAQAEARTKRRMDREEETDARINERVKRFLKNERDGFLQITRLGPVEMPSIELGVIGQVRNEQLGAMTIANVLSGMFGGGVYKVEPYRSDNSAAEADAATVQVVGDPKPKTKTGRQWLTRTQREGTLDEPLPPPQSDGAANGNMMQFMMTFIERDKERDRQRADADEQRRRHENEERAREWKERQDEAKAAREKELTDLKEQRAREREDAKAQRDRDLAEFNARTSRDAEAAKARLDAQIETMKKESEFRIEQMRLDAEAERDRRKMLLDQESRQLESKSTGGLGFEGIGKIREMVAEAVGKSVLKTAGIEEEDDESSGLGGAIADVLRQEGPELIQKAASLLLPRLANWIPAGAGAAPQLPNTEPHRLPPPSAAAPEPIAPDFSTEPEMPQLPGPPAPAATDVPDAPQPVPGGVATEADVLRAATNFAIASVLQFVRPLTVLATSQPEPAAAWDAEVGGNGQTLGDFYRLMYREARVAVAADWPKFMEIVKAASPTDAEHLAKSLGQDGGDEWHREFLAAGPWVPEEV